MKTGDKPTWLLLLVFAVTPAICEELAFRGFILSGLARGGRLAIAIGISSMMFGIIHMIPQQAFNAALLGLVLGLLAIYSRSLFPGHGLPFLQQCDRHRVTITEDSVAGFQMDILDLPAQRPQIQFPQLQHAARCGGYGAEAVAQFFFQLAKLFE
jgi:hypothetical protein